MDKLKFLNPVLWQSVSIGMYILGLGAGAFRVKKTPESKAPKHALHILISIETKLILMASISATAIFVLHICYRLFLSGHLGDVRQLVEFGLDLASIHGLSKLSVIAICQMIIFIIGYFSAHELPI